MSIYSYTVPRETLAHLQDYCTFKDCGFSRAGGDSRLCEKRVDISTNSFPWGQDVECEADRLLYIWVSPVSEKA
jgi:hypothetical protein